MILIENLILYHDSECNNPIEDSDPDIAKKPVVEGSDFSDEKKIYIKSNDTTLTYENVSITAKDDNDDTTTSGEVDITYALDNDDSPGSYQQTLSLPDSDYSTAYTIWRKVYSPNVTEPFDNTAIKHNPYAEKYKK